MTSQTDGVQGHLGEWGARFRINCVATSHGRSIG
jgi:hypothetical protein